MRTLGVGGGLLLFGIGLGAGLGQGGQAGDLRRDFAEPPAVWKSRPLWFWNAPPSRQATETLMEQCRASGYQGFGILPTETMGLEFMSAEYLERYAEAVDQAAALGMNMCLYDEFWFPSGAAGGQLAAVYPEAVGQRLDLTRTEVNGPAAVRTALPPGKLMAAVAMHRETQERVDLGGQIREGTLEWSAPPGPWSVLLFACVPDGARGLMDYLDPAAAEKFIRLTYAKYHAKLGRHFGKTIDSAFYDEPTFHWVQGGRAWTPAFNDRFRARYGYDPARLYPALWFDIGPETAAARNALFGFRAELFATGFVKTLADWCKSHGIELTGHVDQEEVVNPVGLCGDLIKCFEHQPIPGVDQIFQYGRGSKAYKIISSAAANYDRRRVMTECYGGIANMPVANLYKEAMDQFAKGINVMVPHAVWYATSNVIFEPELSPRTAPYAAELPAYNRYIGRLQRLLQHGQPVVDIGVLYPIAGLQAGYRFDVGKPYEGGVIPPEADYMDLGEILALQLRQDFTFVHPEVLDAKCRVENRALRLRHPRWSQAFRVFLVPGGSAIHVSNLRKLKAFHDRGGHVIFTTCLPRHAAEFGGDAEVTSLLRAMLGPDVGLGSAAEVARVSSGRRWWNGPGHRRGGRAYFVPKPDAAVLREILAEALPTPDVAWETLPEVAGGNLTYLHKQIDGRQVYFVANSSDTPVETTLRLRGRRTLEGWDPHTGSMRPWSVAHVTEAGQAYTRVALKLPPVRSVFLVEPR